MTLLVVWVVFPLLLTVLALGVGLLIEGIAQARLPRALLAPLGFAGVVAILQPPAMAGATAELGTPLLVAAAIVGFARSYPWRGERFDPWPIAAALGVFVVFAAPVVLSGEATIAGYIELDDTASWLALSDRAVEDGASAAGLPPSSYEATLDFYLSSQGSSGPGRPWLGKYPLGTFLPLGTTARLVGEDPAWLYQPYISLLAAMLSLTLYAIAGIAVRSRPLRSAAAFLSAQPALVFAYALWGGAKELASALLLGLVSALLPLLLRNWGHAWAVLPVAVTIAATVGVLGSSGAVWVLPALVLGLTAAVRAHGWPAVVRPAALLGALTAAMSIPALVSLRFLGSPAATPVIENDRLANLIQPLSLLQAFGVWPNGEFRLPPSDLVPTVTLIAVVAAGAIVGLREARRRGAWGLLVYASGGAAACALVVAVASPWVDAKALMIVSPAVVLAAGAGVAALLGNGRRIEGAVVAGALVGGILWSNVLAYREVNLAPRERLTELERLGATLAGQGPTLMTDYEPYGARYLLRDAAPEGAGDLRRRQVELRSGGTVQKGRDADIDEFALDAILAYRTLVLRRSPLASRPPASFDLVARGRYYETWQRRGGVVASEHLSLGGAQAVGAQADCAEVRDLARRTGPGGRLTGARSRGAIRVPLGGVPGGWPEASATPGAGVPTTGSIGQSAVVERAGRYELWIGGSYRSRITVSIDGRPVGRSRHELSHDHPYVSLGSVDLARGTHRITVRYHGPDLHPGSDGQPLALGPVVLSPWARPDGPLLEVDPSRYQELCQEPLDWIEASRG